MRDTDAKRSLPGEGAASIDRVSTRARPGEYGVVWTLWLTYGAFYFCRTNISTAVPGLTASIGEGGLALDAAEVGWILASLKIAYGVGQLLNGQLSERISPRVMLAIGMFGSAALNVLFGLSSGFYFLLFVWATNGFVQSLGWSPCMRVTANWVPVIRRGNAIGIIGTGYQITLGLTYVIAAYSADLLGWRAALYVPAALLALAGFIMLVCLRETPPKEPAADGEADDANTDRQFDRTPDETPAATPRISFSDSLYWTLYNPTLWLLGLSLGLLNACRYGFLDWGVTHLMETQKVGVGKAGLQFFVIAIGATAGSYVAGWATDRFFGSRRAPVICVLMLVLCGTTLVYDAVVRSSVPGTMLLLVVIGFCIYGPQVLLVGTAPVDMAHRGAAAAAAGFVNFLGYMGAATGDVVTGYYSADEHGGWKIAIYIWAAWAFAGAVITALLWNTTARKVGLLWGIVPKLAAAAHMLAAGVAITLGGQPHLLQAATYAAAACVIGSFFTRWAALPALLIAAGSLVFVFAAYVYAGGEITWSQTAAMAAYGLAMIAALMILVEKKDEPCA